MTFPEKAGSLCARMSRGFNGQDAAGLLCVLETDNCTKQIWGGVSGALNCMHDQQAVVYPGVGITSPQNGNNPQPGDPAPSLTDDSRNYLVNEANPPRRYIVRRLTPLECCRLQGFPDWWEDGADGSDSARYKMWGNGIALPCAADVLGRVAEAIRKEAGT